MPTVRLPVPRPLALLALAAVALLAGCGAQQPTTGADAWRGVVVDRPAPRPAFTLTDTSGAAYDFATRTAGEVTLLFHGFTNCTDICPAQMADVAAALRRLPQGDAAKVAVVFVTDDPARDSAPAIRAWLDRFDKGLPHPFVGLRGTMPEVEKSLAAAGLPAPRQEEPVEGANYQVDHAAAVLAYGKDDLNRLAYPTTVVPEDYLHDLPLLLAGDVPPTPSAADRAADIAITGATGRVGDVTVIGARLGRATAGAADLSVSLASSGAGDTLTGVASPAATAVSLVDAGGAGPLTPVLVGGHDAVALSGPRHLRLDGLQLPGGATTVPVTFTFATAGPVTIDVPIS